MNSTENLLNLLQQYETSTQQVLTETVEELTPIEITTKINDTENKISKDVMKLEKIPKKVHYFEYKNYHYRREVDENGNITWEVIHFDLAYKIDYNFQINVLEERIKNIID